MAGRYLLLKLNLKESLADVGPATLQDASLQVNNLILRYGGYIAAELYIDLTGAARIGEQKGRVLQLLRVAHAGGRRQVIGIKVDSSWGGVIVAAVQENRQGRGLPFPIHRVALVDAGLLALGHPKSSEQGSRCRRARQVKTVNGILIDFVNQHGIRNARAGGGIHPHGARADNAVGAKGGKYMLTRHFVQAQCRNRKVEIDPATVLRRPVGAKSGRKLHHFPGRWVNIPLKRKADAIKAVAGKCPHAICLRVYVNAFVEYTRAVKIKLIVKNVTQLGRQVFKIINVNIHPCLGVKRIGFRKIRTLGSTCRRQGAVIPIAVCARRQVGAGVWPLEGLDAEKGKIIGGNGKRGLAGSGRCEAAKQKKCANVFHQRK